MGKIVNGLKKVAVAAAAVLTLNNPFVKAQIMPSQRLDVGKIDTTFAVNGSMNMHLKGESTDSSFILESVSIERKMAYEENKVISLFGTLEDTTSNKYTLNFDGQKLVLTSTDADALYRALEIENGKLAVVTLNSDSTVNSYDNWATSLSGNVDVTFSFTPDSSMEISEANPLRTPYGEEVSLWSYTKTDSTSRNFIEMRSEGEFKFDFYRFTDISCDVLEQIKDTTIHNLLHMYVNTGYNYFTPEHWRYDEYSFLQQRGVTKLSGDALPVQEFIYLLEKFVGEDGKRIRPVPYMKSDSKFLPKEGYYQATEPPREGFIPSFFWPTIRGPPPNGQYWNKIPFIDLDNGKLGEAKIAIINGDAGISNVPVFVFKKDETAGKYILPEGTFDVGNLIKNGTRYYYLADGTPTTNFEDSKNFRYTLFTKDSTANLAGKDVQMPNGTILIEDRDPRNFLYWQQTDSKASHYPINPLGSVSEKLMQTANPQLAPNPANETTTLTFNMPEFGNANIKLYNAMGQQIQRIANKQIFPGENSFPINTQNLPTAMYFVHIQTNQGLMAVPMMVSH